jgi:ethanolamine ammonia-lyase large subunit
MAARLALDHLLLATLSKHAGVPCEDDGDIRPIVDHHTASDFAAVASLTVGSLRDWLFGDSADGADLAALARCLALLIGERPGLSSPGSPCLCMSRAPRPGPSDAGRK